ncbi:MAG: hypothetical protein GWM87_08300 [Xanthomonadales bacterium]|nr:hypothetical protein [Xanthomonadales bacterium]NIX12931.1 hypothetical protein [Xanthomonadales bacterium]
MVVAAGLLAGPAAQAQDWDFAGDAGLQLRHFGEGAQSAEQSDGFEASVGINFEARWRNAAGNQRIGVASSPSCVSTARTPSAAI